MSADPPISLTIEPEGDSALRVTFADAISLSVLDAVRRFACALESDPLMGVLEVVPSYCCVTIYYDVLTTDWRALQTLIEALDYGKATVASEARSLEIPVCYDGIYAPDLGDVAEIHGISTDAVIEMHARAEYIVAAVGFVPGFAYLYGLPPALETPRLATPRLRVLPGSVAIGGGQTGIYPMETPGGWRIIGNTPIQLFDMSRDEPALLRPGDRVRFRRIGVEEHTVQT